MIVLTVIMTSEAQDNFDDLWDSIVPPASKTDPLHENDRLTTRPPTTPMLRLTTHRPTPPMLPMTTSLPKQDIAQEILLSEKEGKFFGFLVFFLGFKK